MSLFLSLVFVAYTCAQSLVSSASIDPRTNTCLRRTVAVYTQGSSTYVVSNLGSTSFPAAPTICSNATVTEPASTVTVLQQPSAAGPTVVADAGFENGQQSPFNTSASGPQVSAQVAQSGFGQPLQPYSGDSFLLITFNNSAPAPPRVKRQAGVPQVYNVTQNFAAIAGQVYKLSAYAAQAQNGASAPACSITICGDSSCGASTALTAQYSPYSYQYNAAGTNAGAVATFSISCPQSAYIALDNVTVTAGTVGDVSLTPVTTTILRYITQTQSLQGATQTQIQTPREVSTPPAQIFSLTNTVSTVLWSTATEVVTVPHTEYLSFDITVSDLSTTTTTITQTLDRTTTVNQPPSFIVETATATTTALVTHTDYSLSVLSATPETFTTRERTTLEITTTVPPVTLPPMTEFSTSIVYSTEISTIYISVTLPQATQSIEHTLPPATQSIEHTLPPATESITFPQATFTPPPETTYITVTLPASTITSYVSVTPSPVTEYLTQTATAPTSTLQITETLPAQTTIEIQTQTQTLPAQTLRLTDTTVLPAQTLRFTDTTILPAQTLRFTDTATLPAQTQTSIQIQTFTLPGTTLIQTLTLGQSTTRTTTTTTTSFSSSSSGVPAPTRSGVPAVALDHPTNIFGDAYSYNGGAFDDNDRAVNLPFAVSLYSVSSTNIHVSTNGVLGLGTGTSDFGPAALPQYADVNTGVFAMYEDLYIYAGVQQGIYYQIDGTAPSRTATFEYYLAAFGNPNTYYHFLILFFENRPNIVTMKYLNVTDKGVGATIGTQSQTAGKFKQYSNQQAIIYNGLQLTFDTSAAAGNGLITVDNPGTP